MCLFKRESQTEFFLFFGFFMVKEVSSIKYKVSRRRLSKSTIEYWKTIEERNEFQGKRDDFTYVSFRSVWWRRRRRVVFFKPIDDYTRSTIFAFFHQNMFVCVCVDIIWNLADWKCAHTAWILAFQRFGIWRLTFGVWSLRLTSTVVGNVCCSSHLGHSGGFVPERTLFSLPRPIQKLAWSFFLPF